MPRKFAAPALVMMVLAGSAAAGGTKNQPVTPAVKAFANRVAMKYAKTPCVGQHQYGIDVDSVTARAFNITYKQGVNQLDAVKASGLYYESGKQGDAYWFATSVKGKDKFIYIELRNGRAHDYACDIHL